MAQAKTNTQPVEPTPEGTTADSAGGAAAERAKVKKALRPAFSEIARLSATLGMARQACYTGEPDKIVRALSLLSRQLPLAQETASLLVPSSDV